jgi:hypothetical protein
MDLRHGSSHLPIAPAGGTPVSIDEGVLEFDAVLKKRLRNTEAGMFYIFKNYY